MGVLDLFERSRMTRDTLPPTLYHYTSETAKNSIISNQEIWAVKGKDHVTDPQEISYGINFVLEVLERHKFTGTSRGSALVASLQARHEKDNDCTEAFITSFSSDKDSVTLRNDFGGEAVSWAADPRGLEPSLSLRYADLFRVIYHPDEQRDRIVQVVSEWEKKHEAAEKRGVLLLQLDALDTVFFPLVYCMKAPAFQFQSEWRLVLLPKLNDFRERLAEPQKVLVDPSGKKRYVTIRSIGPERVFL